jgi:hypothetical protein
MFFLRDDWIETQRTKLKNMVKIGGAFQICLKSTFESPILLDIK